jgi:hypothetical protein
MILFHSVLNISSESQEVFTPPRAEESLTDHGMDVPIRDVSPSTQETPCFSLDVIGTVNKLLKI